MSASTSQSTHGGVLSQGGNGRMFAMLRAVSCGRAEMTCSQEPDLFIDGLPCCDQYAAHELARQSLIRPARPAPPGHRVPALLTIKGAELIDTRDAA